MRLVLQYTFWGLGLVLQVLVLQALLRGAWRRHVALFGYSIVLFLTTIFEVAAYTGVRTGAAPLAHSWRVYYWVDDLILQSLIFCVVISLIYKSSRQTASGVVFRRWLVGLAPLVFVLSLVWHRGPFLDLSAWMTLVARDLSFSAAILDLLLWSILISSKKKDPELLMLSGALGIQFTGEAIGQSIRQLAIAGKHEGMALAGSVLVVTAGLICLYIWYQTFSRRFAP